MNSVIRYSAIAMAVASFAACVKEVPAPTPNKRPEIEVTKELVMTDMSFEARLGESLSSVWDGQVKVYDNVADHEASLFDATQVNGVRAVLKGKAYNPADMYYGLYPATAFESFAAGVAVRSVPSAQAVKPSDALLAPTPQVAFAQALSTELKFTPVAAYASFTVKAAELASFSLRAAGDENVAGQTEVDVFQKDVEIIGGEKTITVTADGKRVFESRNYAVEVLPGEYKNGFVATLTFEDGSTFVNTFPEAVEIHSGDVVEIGDITDNNVYAPVVKVDATAFTDAKISWSKVETAGGYKVYSNGELVAALGADALSYKVAGLSNESANMIKVEAYNERTSASSEEVCAVTKGLRKSTQSTGTTFLCIDWDSVLRTRNDGKEQAYQVQICEDQACTKVIYDFVPHTGQKQTNPVFGNSSYYGRTTQLQDGISCTNIMTPTRVSVGGFYPATTYYVRVRTLASAKVKNATSKGSVSEATITNEFGDSEWSEAVAMTTDTEKTLDSKTLFYTGFNDFCVQSDYKGIAPGAVPFAFASNLDINQCWVPWQHPNRDTFVGLTFYCAGDGQHQTNTFNLTKDGAYVDGATTENGRTYLVGRPKGEMNAITGDVAGWHFCQWCRPFMGMCGMDGAPVSIATPNVKEGQVGVKGDPCSISFSAVARVRPDDNYAGKLKVRVWRAATKTFEEIGVVSSADLLPYPEGSASSEFKSDFTGHMHNFTATLNVGDAVELLSTAAGIILVDDILITKGVNIDNVDRDPIEW